MSTIRVARRKRWIPTAAYEAAKEGGVWVYRCYGRDDALLYVGVTEKPVQRFHGHNTKSAWWPLCVSAAFERFDTRPDAEAREAELIRDRQPLHNVSATTGRFA